MIINLTPIHEQEYVIDTVAGDFYIYCRTEDNQNIVSTTPPDDDAKSVLTAEYAPDTRCHKRCIKSRRRVNL